MYICKLLSFIHASALYAQIAWQLNKKLFSLNYFFHAIHVCCHAVLGVCKRSKWGTLNLGTKVLKSPWKYPGNPLFQLPTGAEICSDRFYQWKFQCLFYQAQLCYRKKIAKDVCFYFHISTNQLLWDIWSANKGTSHEQQLWLSTDSPLAISN